MNVTWLLSGNNNVNNQILLSEIDRHDDKSYIIKPFGELPTVDGPVISMVPLDMCTRVLRSKLYPGAYCNLQNLKCGMYYPYFKDYLLNNRCIFLPLGMVRDAKEDLFKWLGEDETIFIRPDSGFKNFTGHTISYSSFHSDIDSIRYTAQDDNLLCLISQPVNLLKEWRFVIGKRKIITSSQYRDFHESPSGLAISGKELSPGSPEDVQKFVEKVLSAVDWEPDSVYTMDVGQTAAARLVIIELNCFTSAGLYMCNMGKIVSEVRKIVIEDYNDVQFHNSESEDSV